MKRSVGWKEKKLQKLWRARVFIVQVVDKHFRSELCHFFFIIILDQRLYNRFNYIIIGQSSKEEENQNIILPLTVAMNSL